MPFSWFLGWVGLAAAVLAAVLMAAALLAPNAVAAATPIGPPAAKITVIVTELNINPDGRGTLVFQPQVAADAGATSYSVLIPATDSAGTGGHWVGVPKVVDAAHNTTCLNSPANGALVYVCRPTVGSRLPTGRYLTSVPVQRIGPLTVYTGTVSARWPGNGRASTFQVVDRAVGPLSTVTVREVHVDNATGNADVAVNLDVAPGELVTAFHVLLAGSAAWFHNPSRTGNLHGLACEFPDAGVNDPHRELVCAEPDGSPLPVGTMSVVYPANRVGPPIDTDTGFTILYGPQYNEANRVREQFVIS